MGDEESSGVSIDRPIAYGGATIWPMDTYRNELRKVGISVEKIPENILDLLRQDEWWRPFEKPPVRLVDMTVSHRRNLVAWLERRAFSLHLQESFRNAMIAVSPIGPGGDMACDAFDSMSMEHDRKDPREWLDEQPLVQKLRELIPPEKHVEGLDLDWDQYYD